jgi:hypothetical protein
MAEIPSHLPEGHSCPEASCVWSYPSFFEDDPAAWGLLPERELSEAELNELECEP